jgi:Na+-driven multidrug efflux pump
MLAHALIFAAANAGNLAERALLVADTAATAALGLGWTSFCLLTAFTTNVIGACLLVVARRTGEGDDGGARAAARLALLLALGGAALGIGVAVVAGAVAVFAAGLVRDAALFLATQGLALGPLLAVQALWGYFAGTLRLGPRLLAAVSAFPLAVHLAFAWLLTSLLAWSVVGAGLARLAAALAAIAAGVVVARAELRRLVVSPRWPDRGAIGAVLREGSLLGLQQVVAGLMVLVLHFRAAGAGEVVSAALTLTHAGAYPLLFCFAWGSSQAVGAAAARAAGSGDPRELARITWLGLAFSAVLAFGLPWGAYAACGRPALAWLVNGNPTGPALLAASLRFMSLLAVFFVFDFAINFLSALLRAVKEVAYLLTVTAATAGAFGLLLLVLPPPDGPWLMGAFILAQAAWAGLLLFRVVSRWPLTVAMPRLAVPPERPEENTIRPGRVQFPCLEMMHSGATAVCSLQPGTGLLPPTLRALALGVLLETAVPLPPLPPKYGPVPPREGDLETEGEVELWQGLS